MSEITYDYLLQQIATTAQELTTLLSQIQSQKENFSSRELTITQDIISRTENLGSIFQRVTGQDTAFETLRKTNLILIHMQLTDLKVLMHALSMKHS